MWESILPALFLSSNGTFNICITDPAPANDNCAGAVTLTSNATVPIQQALLTERPFWFDSCFLPVAEHRSMMYGSPLLLKQPILQLP